MANYFISGCGTLDRSAGTFVVPTGTTIYFFNPPNSLLESHFSDFFMNQLCTDLISPTAEAYVRALSVEVAPEGESVQNYVAMGSDLGLREPAGLYLVGRPTSKGPVVRLLDGVRRTLKDLVSGITEGGSIGAHVYWGVSRKDRGSRVGGSPKQYFDPAPARNSNPSMPGRGTRYRGFSDYGSPLGAAGFVLGGPTAPVDYIDYPKFREFKAKLRTGDGTFDRKSA